MNTPIYYISAILLVLCILAGYLSFNFYGKLSIKNDQIEQLQVVVENNNKEIEKYKESQRLESERVLDVLSEKESIESKYQSLKDAYDNPIPSPPNVKVITNEVIKIVQPDCSIPEPNFRMLKQAFCSDGNDSNFCSKDSTL